MLDARAAPRGRVSGSSTAADWRARRSYRAEDFSVADLARRRCESVSVILPAREVADTVGGIVKAIARLRRRGLVDEILVIDAASTDGTARVADAQGARVVQENELLSEHGPALGKGDAMLRGLDAASGELVVYLDADTQDFHERFVVGLLGPLLANPAIDFVKGAYRRPFRLRRAVVPGEGGRVTELVARPLLNLYAPELAGFDQPLAGEIGARRALLERLTFPAGYGIEIAMLLDAAREVGLDALAQCDLGARQNRHQPLRDLSAMAYAVLTAAAPRLDGRQPLANGPLGALILPPADGTNAVEVRQVPVAERPPLAACPTGRAPAEAVAVSLNSSN